MKRFGLYFAWLLAMISVLVSLYFSDVLNYEPCHLCWCQRVCLFTLPIILGIATHRGFHQIIPFVLPQVFLGFLCAAYQIAIQEIPGWNPIDICGRGPSCSLKVDIGLGPITIPMLSAATFAVLALLLFWTWCATRKHVTDLFK